MLVLALPTYTICLDVSYYVCVPKKHLKFLVISFSPLSCYLVVNNLLFHTGLESTSFFLMLLLCDIICPVSLKDSSFHIVFVIFSFMETFYPINVLGLFVTTMYLVLSSLSLRAISLTPFSKKVKTSFVSLVNCVTISPPSVKTNSTFDP